MRRRTYLRATGLAALALTAGCSENGQEDIEVADSPTDGEPQEQVTEPGDGATEAPAEDTEAPTETPTPRGGPDVTITDHELVVDEGEYTTDVYVAATVENAGNAPSGTVELTADWYDADGNYLDNNSAFLQSLGAGETWAARVYYLGTSGEDVDDYEIEGEYGTQPSTTDPEGLALVDSEMNVGDDEVVITGQVENRRDEAVSYIQSNGKVYDSEGVVLGDEWTNVTDVPAGETWSFELTWRGRDRVEQAADHDVWISDSAL